MPALCNMPVDWGTRHSSTPATKAPSTLWSLHMHAWPEPHLSRLLIAVVCKWAKVTLQDAHTMQGKSTA